MHANEILNKYNHLKFKFRSYYKFTFSFKGLTEEDNIIGYIGGSADDIYRLEVSPQNLKTIYDMDRIEINGINFNLDREVDCRETFL
jgi:hypothetical protein